MAGPAGVDAAVQFTARVFRPVANWITDDDIFDYVNTLGWRLPSVPSGLVALNVSAAALQAAAANLQRAQRLDTGTSGPLAQVSGALTAVLGSLALVPASLQAELPPGFVSATQIAGQFNTRLLDRLIVDAISDSSPAVRALLIAVGVIEVTPVAEVPDPDPANVQPAFLRRKINLDRISQLFTDPKGLLRDVYGWGTPQLDVPRFFSAFAQVSSIFLVAPDVRYPSPEFFSAMFPGVPPPTGDPEPILEIPLLGLGFPPLAVGVIPAPKANPGDAQGLALRLVGTPSLKISEPIAANTTLNLDSDFLLDAGLGVALDPVLPLRIVQNITSGAPPKATGKAVVSIVRSDGDDPVEVFVFGGGSKLTARSLLAELSLRIDPTDFAIRAAVEGGVLHISLSEADGFLAKVLPAGPLDVKFDLGIGWSSARGVFFSGSAGIETVIDLDFDIGPVFLDSLAIALQADQGGLHLKAGLNAAVSIGPVQASVTGLGVKSNLEFRSGNLGRMDLGVAFLPPSGVGIAVDGGAISGGGFLAFEPGRYSGAIELEAYSISIKAFGLIETGAAGGGFSFVIVISTEFATPIQLGLGFTLNGVGGMIGINRTVNSDALRALVVAGRTENLLFPKNVIANAPAIIRDLGTVFPAREGHYVFGPLAKLGWGTPTLITAQLALILELPGPVLTLIGEVKCLLPKPQTALVKFNMSIAGQLDFPKKSFSLDAALHDSVINGYPVSGEMAMRLKWGEQPNFALSIGGFHPAYQPPPNFPKLQPLTVALAQQSSTSVTVSGFFALTSNTLQIGGEARLHAGGSGISLDASIAVKTIFIFSPFSFAANIDASVKISFRGYGPSVHLHGVLSGPSPWRAKGEVCVSILWWDACLRFDQTFGGSTTVPEPVIDPWLGSTAIEGLKTALENTKNWAALPPPGSFAVVSRAAGADDLVDPLGGFTVRQKVAPVETTLPIARFGPAKAAEPPANRTGPIIFKLSTAVIVRENETVALTRVDTLKDFFAPAQFFELNEAKKLSSKSFEKHGAGYSFAVNLRNLALGASASRDIKYTTVILGSGMQADPPDYDLPPAHLTAKSFTSAVARGGFAQSGTRRYVDPAFTQPVAVSDTAFTLAHTDSLQPLNPGDSPLPRADALVALDAYIAQHPDKRAQIQVVPLHELAAA